MASDHPTNCRECFRKTLEKWLQLNVGVTWGNLELSITNANRESLSLQPLTTSKRFRMNVASLLAIPSYVSITY